MQNHPLETLGEAATTFPRLAQGAMSVLSASFLFTPVTMGALSLSVFRIACRSCILPTAIPTAASPNPHRPHA
jgi:hypothetical protein